MPRLQPTQGELREPARSKGLNKATVRTLEILTAFSDGAPSHGLSELSQTLGMSKNMVYRGLQTLMEQGYLVRDAEGTRYQLGYRVVELRNPHFPEPDLRTLCAPFLGRLHEVSGETVRLCVRAGDFMVIIDGIESHRVIASRVGVGSLFPLHISPAARVLLAALPDEAVRSYIERNSPLSKATPTTISDRKALLEDVRLTREQGYALGYADGSVGTSAIAFPIRGANETLFGSVVVAGPIERFGTRLEQIRPELMAIVGELNRRTHLYNAPPELTPRRQN